MNKYKIVVSDFHLGKGRFLANGSFNPLEDFFFDNKFIDFLRYYREGPFQEADLELICNGDFFNHLHLDILEADPDVINEKVALRRMNEILKGHPQIFEEMARFAKSPGHRITFILGNHDPGLLFPAVVRRLREVLGEGITVRLDPYRFDGVHVEHGNQFFADNAYNPRRYFLSEGLPAPIVNLPWGSYFVIHLLNKVRQERPYFSKVYPFKYYLRWALVHETFFALKTIARIVSYFLWIRFHKDPRRYSSFRRTIKIIKEVGLTPNLFREAKKVLLTEREVHTVIFSHTHHPFMRQIAPGKTYINTGLWNEQISLEPSNPGRLVQLTYALLEYDENGIPHSSLKIWHGEKRITEDFYD